jgi:nicotinamidase-related amidase
MAQLTYEKEITGLILIDPYNDFISEGGKIWDRIKGVAEGNQCIPYMMQILESARKNGIRVFYAMHRRYRPGDYESWKYIAPIQKAAWSRKSFEYGTWGGEIRAGFEPQRAMSSPRRIGVPAALLTRTWICSSRSTAFTKSSSWD